MITRGASIFEELGGILAILRVAVASFVVALDFGPFVGAGDRIGAPRWVGRTLHINIIVYDPHHIHHTPPPAARGLVSCPLSSAELHVTEPSSQPPLRSRVEAGVCVR